MLSSREYITDLFVVVDDLLPNTTNNHSRGRPSALTESECITILLWNLLTLQQKTLKQIYFSSRLHYPSEFHYPTYVAFVYQCHRILPWLVYLLEQLCADETPLRFVDSTFLEVCKNVRVDSHKVAKTVAAWGKNHQGWHYGFKLHLAIDHNGRIAGLVITPGNTHDAQALPSLVNKHTLLVVGDGGYTAKAMRDWLHRQYGTVIISPSHPKQKTKLITWWQNTCF